MVDYELIESILKKYFIKILLEKNNTRLLIIVLEHQIGESGKLHGKEYSNDHVQSFISYLKDFFLEKHLCFIPSIKSVVVSCLKSIL